MIKSIVFLIVLLSMNALLIECKNETEKSKPTLSLNDNYNMTFLNTLNNDVFIKQALSYIFTGSYNGSNEIEGYDDNSLDKILELGLLIYADLFKDDEDGTFITDLLKLQTIVQKLNNTGTSSVFVKDIKQYLKIENLQYALQLYLAQNGEAINRRFEDYLMTEFLGNVKNSVCKTHSALWFQRIRNYELWALQMLDAAGKLPAGLMNANINWLGNYKQCNAIYHDFNTTGLVPIQGKHCRTLIGFPIQQLAGDLPVEDNIGLNIGACFSSHCENEDVASIVSNSLKLIGVFKYSWVNETRCDIAKTVQLSTASIVFIVLLSIVVGVVLIATAYDIIDRLKQLYKSTTKPMNTQEMINLKQQMAGVNVVEPLKKPRKSWITKFLINCSFYTNTEKFFRTDNGGKITCLNGIRFFSMVWIIWGHTYNYLTDRTHFFLLDNIRDLQQMNEELSAQLIINGMYGVDTFFLMSAFLLTLSLMAKLEKSKGLSLFEWVYFYVHRYWRLMPPYLITIVIFVFIMPYLGSGPLFNADLFPPNKKDCYKYWYTYVLFINNFVPDGKGTQCMGYLWYIPNDYQFYAISPVFILILYRFPKAGKILLAFCMAASLSILAMLTANVYESRNKDIIQVLIDMWSDVYIKPYCRAAPFIVGILLGYLFFKKKSVALHPLIVASGWILSTVLALTAIFGGYTNHAKDSRRMETAEYAIYFSITRLTWPLAISWIIFACHYGYGGIINTFLSVKNFIPLTRLSYCAYLIHPPIMVFFYYSQQALFHANTITLVYVAIGHIFVTFILSFIYSLLFELPFVAMEKIVYDPKKEH